LVSGTAGTGKTSVAAYFVDAACRRGERSLFFAFEESPAQIIRNMRSIGLDLARWVRSGRLVFQPPRPAMHGLEMRLAQIHPPFEAHRPTAVVFDPVTSLTSEGTKSSVDAMLLRLVDFLKTSKVTAMFTSLTHGDDAAAEPIVGISSLMDTWLRL